MLSLMAASSGDKTQDFVNARSSTLPPKLIPQPCKSFSNRKENFEEAQ